MRVVAAWVVDRTLGSLAPLESFLDSARTRCDPRDHALLEELVLGSLRWLRRLDQVIGAAATRDFETIEPALRGVLRIATYQLMFLHRIPAHQVVQEAVEEAHCLTHRGGASFVNGVLRRLARERSLDAWPVGEPPGVRRLAVEMSHPDFLVKRWWRELGEERTRTLLAANNYSSPLHLQAFRDRGGRELLAEELIDAGVDLEASSMSPLGLKVRAGDPYATEAFGKGDFDVQDEACQVASLIPQPRPGERVLEVASAYRERRSVVLMGWESSLHCTLVEASEADANRVRRRLRRLRRPLPLVVADPVGLPLAASFDRVVVTLPGSDTGRFTEHPELKWRIREGEIGRLADSGLRKLEAVLPLLAPGAVLVVMTRSLENEDNAMIVEELLRREPGLMPMPLEDHLPPALCRDIVATGFWRCLGSREHSGATAHVLTRPA